MSSRAHARPSDLQTDDAALVLPFAELDRASLAIAGGKAANLGELTRAGLPVPPGFCVTTAAFALFMAEHSDIYALLDPLAADDLDQVRQAGAQIRAALRQAPIPAAVAEAVG